MWQQVVESIEQTQVVAKQIVHFLHQSMPACFWLDLVGEMGAGKTTLARGLLNQLGVEGAVRSPTYTLMEVYRADDKTKWQILHFDFYRLSDPREVEMLGIDDYLYHTPTLCLTEWRSNVAQALPTPNMQMTLSKPAGSEKNVRLIVSNVNIEC